MTSPESGSREPTTEAGQAMLRDPMYRFAIGHVTAIESEAVERFAEALVRAVKRMATPKNNRRHWAPNDYAECVSRAAVLAAIAALRSPADTGEHQEGDVGS